MRRFGAGGAEYLRKGGISWWRAGDLRLAEQK